MQDRDFPLGDLRPTAEDLGSPVAYRPQLLLAGAHRLLRLPCGRDDAATRAAMDNKGQADAPVHRQQRCHPLVADVRDAASIDSGCARTVVECACTIHPLPIGVAAPAAPSIAHVSPAAPA
jgi:hypothetical protein